MRTIHRIAIGVLVGLFFASGYAARKECARRQAALIVAKDNKAVFEGTRIASTRLADVSGDVDIRPLETLYTVLNRLREHYVEQLTVEDEGKMTHEAMRAMLAWFRDPNTRFIEQPERRVVLDAEHGKFHGIGAVLAIKQIWRPSKDKPKERVSEEHLVVVTLLPGSPAAKAGLKPGDEIVAIDGRDVLPFDPYQHVSDLVGTDRFRDTTDSQKRKMLDAEQKRIDEGIGIVEAEALLTGEQKKAVTLTLAAKPPAKPTRLTILPQDMVVDVVGDPRMETSTIGYIDINYFGSTTADEFAQALRELQAKSAKALIVDLRGATGGDMGAALKIAQWFEPGRNLAVLIKSRGRKTVIQVPSTNNGEPWRKPVVLLVDRGTARAPEVLAAGLREVGAAKLVGEKTYGNFTDSTLIDLADGSGIVMATGKYVTAKGYDYNGKGLPVDVQAATSDEQMKAAIKLLTGGKS